MYQDHYLEIEPGMEIHYYDEGQGQTILFVPGWCGCADVFCKQIDDLSKDYRCIAIDPRCHGKSSICHRNNTYLQQGKDLNSVITMLGLDHVILAGWSFGALACWTYVRQFGLDRVAGVVIIDNSPRSITDDVKEYRAGTIDNLRGDHAALQSDASLRAFMGGFADSLPYEGKMTPEFRSKFIDDACRIPCEIADDFYVDGWLADERETVKLIDESVPSLLYIANYRKEAGVPYMKEHYPNTEIHAFGMHMMFHEYPEKFNGILRTFLENKVR